MMNVLATCCNVLKNNYKDCIRFIILYAFSTMLVEYKGDYARLFVPPIGGVIVLLVLHVVVALCTHEDGSTQNE